MTEAEIKHYLSLDPDKTLKPVPENHPEQFNYEAFHAKLVEMEERRAAYDNWKNGKKMKKGDRR